MREKKYLVELTPIQMLTILEWHESNVDKYRQMGVKENYLKFHKEDNLAEYIKGAYELVKDERPIFDVYDRRISQSEIPSYQ